MQVMILKKKFDALPLKEKRYLGFAKEINLLFECMKRAHKSVIFMLVETGDRFSLQKGIRTILGEK